MNPELENLINMALADGEVTEKEKAIILRKAESVGEDKDEIEMILDGRIALMKKEQAKQAIPPPPLQQESSSENKSQKEGAIKKCPSCGAPVQSFSTNCSECGHEFRNTEAVSSITKLFELLDNISKESTNEDFQNDVDMNASYMKRLEQQLNSDNRIKKIAENRANRQMEIIRGFPVPNAKEDILEFLSQAFPKAKPRSFWSNNTNFENEFQAVWKTKCEEIIIKARFSIKDDKSTLEQIENYAKQLKIK